MNSLESELQRSTAALKVANEEASKYRSKANQLQGIVESAERTRQQQQKGLKKQATSMQEAQATITTLTSRNSELVRCIVSCIISVYMSLRSTGRGAIEERRAHS